MIDFNGKNCDALAARIAAAGLDVMCVDGQLQASDPVAVQAIIDAWSLSDAIAAKKHEIADRARDLQDAFVARLGYSSGERDTWAIKGAEAEAVQAGGGVEVAPTLALETTPARPLANVAARVLANANAYGAFAGAVARNRAVHQDAVAALIDFAQIRDYDHSAGWPALP